MTQTTAATVRPPAIVLADPAVPYPTLTGSEPCRQTDPDRWFPEQGQNDGTAVTLCRTSCPVLQECRRWTLANPHLTAVGIWGGMTRSERVAARRNTMEAAV